MTSERELRHLVQSVCETHRKASPAPVKLEDAIAVLALGVQAKHGIVGNVGLQD